MSWAVKFRDELNGISSWITEELDGLIAQISSTFEVEHDVAGHHTVITGTSINLTSTGVFGGTITTAGSVVATGQGLFGGIVKAFKASLTNYVSLEDFGAGLGSGIRLNNGTGGTASQWIIAAIDAAVTRALQFRDVLSLTTTYVFRIGAYSGGTGTINYSLVPESTTGFSLGENSSGKRIDQVNTKSVTTNAVTFPASQFASADANTLDDYEEGTFTPVDASGAGLAFVSAVGFYTKIGNRVLIDLTVQYPATASGLAAAIGGLPFICSASTAGAMASRFQNAGLTYTVNITATTAAVGMWTNVGAAVTNAQLSGSFVAAGGQYMID